MTLQEFRDNYTQYWELEQFCNDHGFWEITEDLMDSDMYNERIRDDISCWLDNGDDWDDIRDRLTDLPDTRNWERFLYLDGEYVGTDSGDDNFDYIKDRIIDCVGDEWDEEEPEEPEEPEEEVVEAPIEDEDIDINEVLCESMELSSDNLSIEIPNVDKEIEVLKSFAETVKQAYQVPEEEIPECTEEDVKELFA